jgi:hypothetical protein
MFKCKMKSLIKYYPAVFIVLLLSIASCTSEPELAKIAELESLLEQNEPNLKVDDLLFNARLAEMDEILRAFKNYYNKTMTEELGNELSKFDVIRKIYMKKLADYGIQQKEQKELTTQIASLKIDVQNGTLSKDAFKEYFRQESDDISKLTITSIEIKKTLYEIEPEYARLYKSLKPISNTINTKLLP